MTIVNYDTPSSFMFLFVGATGFEPATTWSQTRSATGLRYTPFPHGVPFDMEVPSDLRVQRYGFFSTLPNFWSIILRHRLLVALLRLLSKSIAVRCICVVCFLRLPFRQRVV